jgi:hypothetical protein
MSVTENRNWRTPEHLEMVKLFEALCKGARISSDLAATLLTKQRTTGVGPLSPRRGKAPDAKAEVKGAGLESKRPVSDQLGVPGRVQTTRSTGPEVGLVQGLLNLDEEHFRESLKTLLSEIERNSQRAEQNATDTARNARGTRGDKEAPKPVPRAWSVAFLLLKAIGGSDVHASQLLNDKYLPTQHMAQELLTTADRLLTGLGGKDSFAADTAQYFALLDAAHAHTGVPEHPHRWDEWCVWALLTARVIDEPVIVGDATQVGIKVRHLLCQAVAELAAHCAEKSEVEGQAPAVCAAARTLALVSVTIADTVVVRSRSRRAR